VNSTVLEGIVVVRDKSRPGKLVANLPQTCPELSVQPPTLLMSHQTRLNFIENYCQLTHSNSFFRVRIEKPERGRRL
jgi:hypothetical protein